MHFFLGALRAKINGLLIDIKGSYCCIFKSISIHNNGLKIVNILGGSTLETLAGFKLGPQEN